MPAYCLFDVRAVTDPKKVEEYRPRVGATVAQYGGRYRVLGGKFDVVEGDWRPGFLVIVEFPDREQALRWYDSPEYRPLKSLRLAGTQSNGLIVEGCEPPKSAAEVYEDLFVPALFLQWGGVVSDLARLKPGECVLDVACGTGVLALAAAGRVGPEGKVVGLDASADMLGVARRKSARIEWREGRAEAIPYPDRSFDAVVSQFGLMFFEDRAAALREMLRVLRPGGRLAIAVCDALERSPGYAALAALLQRLFGERIADAFRAPFALGDEGALQSLCDQAGIDDAKIERHQGTVRFASIEKMISTERACVMTLGGLLDDAQFERLLKDSERALRPFAAADGKVAFDMPALIVTAVRTAA
ncbi:MAG TPA: DUF1330 domain-containing protein [Burkholderiales bacterium]|nr:DUF1330 domain-containing protein [Burkholderiales bacterium]